MAAFERNDVISTGHVSRNREQQAAEGADVGALQCPLEHNLDVNDALISPTELMLELSSPQKPAV